MKIKYLLMTFLLAVSVAASALSPRAEWFVRGTQNSWVATQMMPGGTNTVEVKNVVFTSAGSVKFDRFGDWKENYGVGGFNGSNIPVAAGTWDIKFYTDTKNWNISHSVQYHLRGTHNGWAEGDLLTRVAGSSSQYEACRNFGVTTAASVPRFKVDPNGGWGADSFPSQDYIVNGWTKIIVDGDTRKIVSVVTKLGNNCVEPMVFANPGPIILHVGDTFHNPINTNWLYYISSNPAVAEVIIYNGNVTVVGVGTATIYAAEEFCNTCTNRMESYVINVLPE